MTTGIYINICNHLNNKKVGRKASLTLKLAFVRYTMLASFLVG
jgi:hypothetical protein